MIENKEHKFDEQIRSIIGDGFEEVPEGIWSSIEQKLPTKSRKVIPLWLKSGIGMAAAAAVVCAVIFSISTPSDRIDENFIAVVETPREDKEDILTAMGAMPEEKPAAGQTNEAAGKKTTTIAEAMEQAVSPENTDSKETLDNKEVLDNKESIDIREGADGKEQEDAQEAGTENEEDWAEDEEVWKRIMAQDGQARRGPRASVTISGNAISNSNSTRRQDSSPVQAFRPTKNEITKDKVSESGVSSFGIPISFGIGTRIEFTPRWSLGVGINYTLLSRNFSGNFYQVLDDHTYKSTFFSDIKNRQDYLGIPVNVYFNILQGKFVNFYAYAGGAAEKCIGDNYRMAAEGMSLTHRESVKGFQFSVDAGIGLEFVIADQFGIYIDPSLRYYFKNTNQPRSIRTMQPLMLGLEMGFRVTL